MRSRPQSSAALLSGATLGTLGLRVAALQKGPLEPAEVPVGRADDQVGIAVTVPVNYRRERAVRHRRHTQRHARSKLASTQVAIQDHLARRRAADHVAATVAVPVGGIGNHADLQISNLVRGGETWLLLRANVAIEAHLAIGVADTQIDQAVPVEVGRGQRGPGSLQDVEVHLLTGPRTDADRAVLRPQLLALLVEARRLSTKVA